MKKLFLLRIVFISVIHVLFHVNSYAYDAQNTGRSLYEGPKKVVLNWSIPEIVPLGFLTISPIVDKKARVFLPFQVISGEQGIMAVSADKNIIWKYDFKDEDRVFFGGLNFSPDESSIYLLYQLRKNTYLSSFKTDSGKIQWTCKIKGKGFVRNRITVSKGGLIYVANERGIHAIDKKGNIVWTIDVKNDAKFNELNSPTLSPDEKTVYCYVHMSDSSKFIYAFNAKDGKYIWRTKDTNVKAGDENRNKRIAIDTTSGTIYVAGVTDDDSETGEATGYLYAINPNGSLKWKYKITATGNDGYLFPAVGLDGTVYIGTGLKQKKDILLAAIIALNPDGKLIWSYELEGINGFNQMISIDSSGKLYFINSSEDQIKNSELHCVDKNGERVFRLSFPGGFFWSVSPSLSPDGSIYVYSGDGKLYSFK